jgi:signal transduction histidine kinase
VARLEAGNVEVSPEDVQLEALIYDVWEKFDEAGAAHRFLTADTDQTAVRTDANLLTQALGNVLENAVKYSPEGSTVAIRSYRSGDEIVIQIEDEGPGIPPERIARIFERVYRSRAEGVPGLGLGLYITRSLIEILGGRVEAGSRGDGVRGLRVTIVLPLRGPPS